MSPSTLSEEGRRELIARQHRALYGPEGSGFSPHGSYNQESGSGDMNTQNQGPGPQGMRGASPRGMDPFGMPQQSENSQQQNVEGKTTSPQSHQQTGAPSPPSGEDTGHARTISKSTTAPNLGGGMGPIGSRPNQQHMTGQSLNKRTTSPLPSSISYGNFGVSDQSNDRNSQSQSNAGQKENPNPAIGTWGSSSGVWGNKIGASVWS